MGRAAGWPARFGLAGGRSGLPPPTGDPGTIVAAGGAAGRGIGRAGPGMLGTVPGLRICPGDGAGRGVAGASDDVRASAGEAGKGCLGPERIWPGLGAGGLGRAGIGIPRGAIGGESGGPEASGGRKGADRGAGAGVSGAASRAGGASGAVSTRATGVRASSAAGTGSETATGLPAGSGAAACGAPFDSPVKRRFTSSATGSSIELEWVFFSVTPSSGSMSRITLGFTSSSRASSLIRILVILCAPSSNIDTGVVEIKPAPYPEPPRLPGTPQFLS